MLWQRVALGEPGQRQRVLRRLLLGRVLERRAAEQGARVAGALVSWTRTSRAFAPATPGHGRPCAGPARCGRARARSSGGDRCANLAVGAPEHEHALSGDVADALGRSVGEHLGLGDRHERAQRLQVPGQRARVVAVAVDDHEHLAGHLDARQVRLHARAALLEVGHEAADLHVRGGKGEEVIARACLVARVLPGCERARRRAVTGDAPAVLGLLHRHPGRLDVERLDVLEAVGHVDAQRALSPSISVPSAVIRTSLIGSSLAFAIARLSLDACEPVDVFRNAASSPSRNAAARVASNSLSCSLSFGALVAAGFGFDWPEDWVVEARLGSGRRSVVASAGADEQRRGGHCRQT